MLNFAVGPVMSNEQILKVGGSQIPYFRTGEFSALMKENEEYFQRLINAPKNARTLFITGSGTASMEAAVVNTLTSKDKALIVNGGSFGERFCQICKAFGVPYEEIKCEQGKTLKEEQLIPYENKGYAAFLVNLGETSTGVLYDAHLIAGFCKRNGLFLIMDCVSSFLCDRVDMEKTGADIIITGSQKALALAPGISVMCLSKRAQDRINDNRNPVFYFDLKKYLLDGLRGQTPFTPAVSVLIQMNVRLKGIIKEGGVEAELKRAAELASYFRDRICGLPFGFFADKQSNAVTSLTVNGDVKYTAYEIFEILKDRYGIFVCPNGGDLRDRVFRVGHMGNLSHGDYDTLIAAIKEIIK